jgi:L-ascorbate metabolism protein UlaG (beta-lactamase superfamily)
MLKSLLLAGAVFAATSAGVLAQAKVSECMAIAQGSGEFLHYAALAENEARLTYAGHSTFILESAGGLKIATDYAGYAGNTTPDVVTMNHAHSSHYTDAPDPAIKHVLRGWGESGEAARHDLEVGDVRIRNVPTDIRLAGGGREKDGNSIFIFEMAGLCIGHLGHLHHELSPGHIGAIGRLDVVMVPVDGGLTLPTENMMNVLKLLRSRVILPMHARFSGSLERFEASASASFAIERLPTDEITVSAASLPKQPTVYIMPGM